MTLPDLTTIVTDDLISVEAADVDGDGDADILCAHGNSATLSVFYGSHEP